MKVVCISTDSAIVALVEASIRMRWPDLTLLVTDAVGDGLDLVAREHPNLALFCPDFADMPLTEAIVRLRRFSKVPLIVLRNPGAEWEMVSALELGADDYVGLPCASVALMARIYALLRRAGTGAD